MSLVDNGSLAYASHGACFGCSVNSMLGWIGRGAVSRRDRQLETKRIERLQYPLDGENCEKPKTPKRERRGSSGDRGRKVRSNARMLALQKEITTVRKISSGSEFNDQVMVDLSTSCEESRHRRPALGISGIVGIHGRRHPYA